MSPEGNDELWQEAIREAHAVMVDVISPIMLQGGMRAAAMDCVMLENSAAHLLKNGRGDVVQFILGELHKEFSGDPT